MWNELVRQVRLSVELVSARITTYYRKLQVRHAYHPVRIFAPLVLIFALVIVSIVIAITTIPKISFVSRQEVEVASDSVVINSSENETPLEYFMAPFPAVEGQDEMEYLLVADKYDRVVHLLKNQRGMWGVIKSYPVAIGANEGRKQVQGDKKTPEGEYFIVSRKEDVELNEIYGPLAYVLNYPNSEDQSEGRTGSGIWIHGTVPGNMPIDTKGCLEMHNNNILKLSEFLHSGDLTPIVIHSNPSFQMSRDVDLESLWDQRQQIIAERTGAIAVANAIDSTTVEVAIVEPVEDTVVEVIEVVVEDTVVEVAVVEVDTIVETVTEPEIVDVPVQTVIESSINNREALVAFVEKWRTDWQSRDINRYQSNYDTGRFQSGTYDWAGWRQKKVRTFNNYSDIRVEVSGIEILNMSETRATVRFMQKYQSDLFRAENGKQITLINNNGNWKIVQELSVRY